MNLLSAAIVAAGIFAAGYFGSMPFRAKVDASVKNHTQWTAQSIENNPSGYLEWATGEYGRLLQSLDARKIGLSYEKSLAEKSVAFERKALPILQTRLAFARRSYLEAEGGGSWPVQIDGESFSRDELGSRILLLNSSVNYSRKKTDAASETIDLATRALPELENLRRELLIAETELSLVRMSEANGRLFGRSQELVAKMNQIQSYSSVIQKQTEGKKVDAGVSAQARQEISQDNLQNILED